ncbi:MAG: ABC transporter substrate-binding protein [Elusimicrobia bacterium]|nr:ABC transporter substrate-binding protein [Elusimicrobiota bacterium]
MLKFTIPVFLVFSLAASVFAEKTPERIISLGPVITEELYLLGQEDKIVGVTVYCQKPDDAKNKEKIGNVMEVNIEKIIDLKPDLVLATGLTKPEQINKLKSLGIRVLSFSIYKNKTFSQICEQFMELGEIVGNKEKAEQIVRKAKKKVKSIHNKTKNLSNPKILMQIGAKPLWIATKDSFLNDFIVLAGGENIGHSGRNGLYSREKVLEQNPDMILIITMGIVSDEEKEIWQKYNTLNAVKNNRIYIIDSYKVCSPTPESFAETLEEIAKLIHPELR